MNQQHSTPKHLAVMFILMVLVGLFVNMNLYVDRISDINLSLNDLYMSLMMTGAMFILTGIMYNDKVQIGLGFITSIVTFSAIRGQWFMDKEQFYRVMIPHHSTAVLMSKKLLEKGDLDQRTIEFLDGIIKTQSAEIEQMKAELNS